jgi:hypothetical protein
VYGVSAGLIKQVRDRTHTQVLKVESLKADLSLDSTLTAEFIDGEVSYSTGNEGRATLDAVIKNKNGKWDPKGFADPFMIGRRLRVYRGVALPSGTIEYAPLGTFQVTRAKPRRSSGEKALSVAAMDLWVALMRSRLRAVSSYEKGTTLSAIIADILLGAGFTNYVLDSASYAINPLSIGVATQWQIGTKRSDMITQLGQDFGWSFWFDRLGVFTGRAYIRLDQTAPVYAIADSDAATLSINGGYEDSDDIANDVFVQSIAPDVTTFTTEVQDTQDGSFTRADGPFGRRVLFVTGDVKTTAQATDAARELLRRRSYLARPEDIESVPLFWLDPWDVVSFTDSEQGITAGKYVVDSMRVPLGPGTSAIGLLEARALG